ncbi:MAG: 3D domain-containing protein [Lacrimispora sphenoides]
MNKKIISLCTALVLVFSLMTPAFAAEFTDNKNQDQDIVADVSGTTGIEPPSADVSGISETEAATEEEIDTAAVNRITFSNWVLNSIQIPDSTSMLSKGVVSDGIITYEVKIYVQVKNNGSNYKNQAITWKTSASATNAKIITKDSQTNSSGIAYITLHVRGIDKLPLTATCGGTSGSKTIDLGTRGTYASSFKRTHYITALESDYSGKKISVSGLNGTYKQDFLSDVKMQGSGKGDDGKFIKYYNGYSYQNPTTATGTTPKVGQTIAVDPYYIPCVRRNGTTYRGYVTVQGGIGHRVAEDTGNAITGKHIDDYVGVGKRSRDNKDGNYQILFMGVNGDGHSANNSMSLSDLNGIEENEGFTPLVPVTCQSEDGRYFAYEKEADVSKVNSVTVSVTRNTNSRSASDAVDFDLASAVTNVDNMQIADDTLVTIGHVNPSTQIYQEFDIDTQELTKQYCGYGFTNTDKGLFYVEAPQQFSGVIGLNRIIDGDGNVLYESGENVCIRGDLELDGATLSFTEFNMESDETNAQTVSITARLDSVSSYYE